MRDGAAAAANLRPGPQRRRQRWGLRVFIAGLLLWLAATGHAQTLLSPQPALYARVVRVSHSPDAGANGQLIASVTSFDSGNHVQLYRSLDEGASFSPLASLRDPEFAGGLCCGTLFELPRPVGDLAAGTLLWAGSVGQNNKDRRMQLKVYSSVDGGRHWSFRSKIVSPNTGGLWEPEFTLAGKGALVLFFSDESHPAQSQIINRARSDDGVHWADFTDTVASKVHADRPGMPVVRRLANGTYFMTFERCGPAACAVSYKTSPDGWDWGEPSAPGTVIRTPQGRFFAHAPTSAVLRDGAILLVGQMELEADGSVAAQNGRTLFLNLTGDPASRWMAAPAPVPVPGAFDNYCPNYSSPLLPSPDGGTVLEFASRYEGQRCLMYFGTGKLGLTQPTSEVEPAPSSALPR